MENMNGKKLFGGSWWLLDEPDDAAIQRANPKEDSQFGRVNWRVLIIERGLTIRPQGWVKRTFPPRFMGHI